MIQYEKSIYWQAGTIAVTVVSPIVRSIQVI